jgi:hypothetical protein
MHCGELRVAIVGFGVGDSTRRCSVSRAPHATIGCIDRIWHRLVGSRVSAPSTIPIYHERTRVINFQLAVMKNTKSTLKKNPQSSFRAFNVPMAHRRQIASGKVYFPPKIKDYITSNRVRVKDGENRRRDHRFCAFLFWRYTFLDVFPCC